MIGDQGFELGKPGLEGDATPDEFGEDVTWHVHEPPIQTLNPHFVSPWGYGIKCTVCAKPKPVHGGGKTVRFMTERLRQHREAGTSAVGMEKEIIDSARADGRLDKIDRAR